MYTCAINKLTECSIVISGYINSDVPFWLSLQRGTHTQSSVSFPNTVVTHLKWYVDS